MLMLEVEVHYKRLKYLYAIILFSLTIGHFCVAFGYTMYKL